MDEAFNIWIYYYIILASLKGYQVPNQATGRPWHHLWNIPVKETEPESTTPLICAIQYGSC